MTRRANFCANCAQKLDPDDKFCPACGLPIAGEPAERAIKSESGAHLLDDLQEFKRSMEQSSGLTVGQVRIYFEMVRGKYSSGELVQSEYQDLTAELMLHDTEGKEWTIGARTGKWYRRVGNQWVEDMPEGPLLFRGDKSVPVAGYCRKCGNELRTQAKFCNKCGVPRR